ncbi:DUF938 domain-containing protein [Pacificimonas sp. WHA3]|uniref:DUF938 domain-containing protein n=1 Tax=Pacificimonas pallii TaxID=2827236 RepID=A0ABS6SDF4_9SPHN|nr:DUF938 domain-containing protein [Pacificimonas pallii]MBV7256438.1 DUF938 domain-containing protein [Pacificimonas pallii]
MSEEELRSAPAALRNRKPIADVLADVLPDHGLVLMIAEGTGEHAVHFASRFGHLQWLPTDGSPDAVGDMERRKRFEGPENMRPPILLNVYSDSWPTEHVAAMTCINMVHISPWSATLALLRGARSCLTAGAPLFIYGPFVRDGVMTAPSNLAFDESLRSRNPEWGLRTLGAMEQAAAQNDFALRNIIEMPANNLSVVFNRN